MRRDLELLGPPDHLGLAYDAWAPVDDDGKVLESKRAEWLSALADIPISSDYAKAYARWKASYRSAGDRLFELELASRLLVGHGNASATDVGLTVHHTWGVPVIPGPALKGLLAHYIDAVYGPTDATLPPWEQPEAERVRAEYQGTTWRGRRIERGPGRVHRLLFGAPDAEQDVAMQEHKVPAGAMAGEVTFHDALYIPETLPGRPFATDVLTVHQKEYYDSSGLTSGPTDYDNPNPVAFLTVRPGTRMLLALSGPAELTELAERLLRDALEQWGVGSKTSAGYGRLVKRSSQKGPPPKVKERVEAVLLEGRTKKGGWRARHESSGLEGHIQNTEAVPTGEKAGNQVTLVVAFVSAKEIAFVWLAE